MSLLTIYAVLLVVFITTYLFINDQLSIAEFKEIFIFRKRPTQQNPKLYNINSQTANPVIVSTPYNLQLHRNLKHLEFMNEFESYLESNKESNLSIEFLQEFEAIKRETQLAVLKSTDRLKKAA